MCAQINIILWLLVALLIEVPANMGQETQKLTGSGFVVKANGYLLTCEHIVKDAVKVEVAIGGKIYEAAVLATDEKRDLALLEIKAKGLPTLPFANSNEVEIGKNLLSFGFPAVSVPGESVKMTKGSISDIKVQEAQKIFQINASVNPGNNGGPLVNERGEVVGVINTKLSDTVIPNIAFAAPINYAKQMLRDEGVEFASEGAKANLDGSTLVKQVSPALALIIVTPKGAKGDVLTPTPSIPTSSYSIKHNPKDGAEMVYIPAGEFLMGSDKSKDKYA